MTKEVKNTGGTWPPTHETLINPLNAEVSPIRHLLALVGARHIVHVSRRRVNISLQCVSTIRITVINIFNTHCKGILMYSPQSNLLCDSL